MEIAKEHVPYVYQYPTQIFCSVGEMVRVFKSISAKEIFLRYPEVKGKLWGGEFWEDGYFVCTVGDKITSDTINNYIRYHGHKEKTPQHLAFDF